MPGCADRKSDCGRAETCENPESTGCYECHGKKDRPAYKEICPPPFCDYYCKGLSAQEVFAKYGDAVLEGHAEFQLTTNSDNVLDPLEDGMNYEGGLETVYTHFNASFIDQHVIIAPASPVFLPPNYTLAYNQWPFAVSVIDGSTLQSGVEARANRIFVDVTNVNGSNHSYTYQADLIGAYLLGDLSVLYIDNQAPWNANIPCIKRCHPHFRLACSRRYRTGCPAFVIGNEQVAAVSGALNNGIANAPIVRFGSTRKTIAKTLIASTRALDQHGVFPQELVTVQNNIGNLLVGGPIINAYGHMIGYLTTNGLQANLAPGATAQAAPVGFATPYQSGVLTGGPSSFFFIDVLRVLLCSLSSRNSDFVETASSPLGDYVRYVHGGLGLAYQVWDGSMYMSSINPANGDVETRFVPGTTDGQYAIPTYRKENLGVRVYGLTVDQNVNGFNNAIYLPGAGANGSTPSSPWVDTPLNVAINDQVVFFENCPLGDQNGKAIAPLLMLSRMRPGDSLLLKYRTAVSDYQTEVSQTINLVRMPLFFNYPLGSYLSFPWLNVTGFPSSLSFSFPQDPSVQGLRWNRPTWSVATIPVV